MPKAWKERFMKRFLLLALIFLTACSSAQATPESYFASNPAPAILTMPAALPLVTESGVSSSEDAGELYFFLQPRQSAGQSIQLAKVSGVCVFDSANCPPLQVVEVPFAFKFMINALNWSPDGKSAAFAYSDNPNGTPTKLWRYDAAANTWTALAEFPYIDPPFWSPDGAWIGFRMQDGAGGEGIYVTRADGSDLRNISAGLPASGKPYIMDGWFADHVLVHSALPGNEGVMILLRASDGAAQNLFATPPAKTQFHAAPDASLLAYDDLDAASQSHVVKVVQPDGANAITLANFAGGRVFPIVWSPDSQRIAFTYSGFVDGNPTADVFVASRSGGQVLPVYKGRTVGRLLFSPNAKYLLVEETTSATGGHLYLVNLATLETAILQAPGLSTDFDWYAPSWKP